MDLSQFTRRLTTEFPPRHEPVAELPSTAAVLVALFPKMGRTHVLLIQRAKNLRLHAGEISFPGGTYEPEDETLETTALRETQEELALEIPAGRIVGRLPQVTTLTGFEVHPFVCILDALPPWKKNPREVAEVLEVPLVPLLATHQRDVGHGAHRDMYVYWYKNYRIWGATAKILYQIGKLGAFL